MASRQICTVVAAAYLSMARSQIFSPLPPRILNWKLGACFCERAPGNIVTLKSSSDFAGPLHRGSRSYSQSTPRSDGPFHEAVLGGDVDKFERLVNSGMDINTPNSVGRLPLHTFCSAPWMDAEFMLDGQVPRPATEWLLQHTNNIDTPDQDGITALHIASMMSQYLVKKLLEAGADPKCTTSDGMNALHLAARARQSNIVGMLTGVNQDVQFQGDLVNARDEAARTPLHYACRSGRPETVSYLIAAGADPTSLDVNGLTPLDVCLEFEEEQALWADYRELELQAWYWIEWVNLPSDWGAYALGGVRRRDDNRPWVRPGRELQNTLNRLPGGWGEESLRIASVQHTARLGEIINAVTKALVDRGEGAQAVRNHIAKCVEYCEAKGLGYTKPYLAGLSMKSAAKTDQTIHECIIKSQFDLEERYGKRSDQPRDHVHLALVDLLLRRRQYDILEHVLRRDMSSLSVLESDVYDIARLLCKHGFAELLGALIDSKYGSLLRSETGMSSRSGDPLLIVAVKRQLPNMEVVRLLVEKLQVDLNSRSRTGEEAYEDVDGPGIYYGFDILEPGLNTALHECAKGFNWWQVKYCLPYLLYHGADPQSKNEAGATPYRLAHGACFCRDPEWKNKAGGKPFESTGAVYVEAFMDEAAKLLQSAFGRSLASASKNVTLGI